MSFLEAKFIKLSDLAAPGCNYSGVQIPGCLECESPIREFDQFGNELMHSHDCPNRVEYACTIKEVGKDRFLCDYGNGKPVGYCKAHALNHAKREHKTYGRHEDQVLRIFAVVIR